MPDAKQEQPKEGGSYVRQKDGSLKRVEQTQPYGPNATAAKPKKE